MQITKEYLKTQQYGTANNLTARRNLFQYGTNSESLWRWLAKQYAIQPGNNILEVGCGNGDFWQETSKILPKNCSVTLTDFSAGMLASAKKNLTRILNCQFEVADVEHLTYNDQSFDIVFAHLMLYHTNSPEHALIEIKRVLKKTGFAGILLSGADNMQTLFTLLNCENPRQSPRFSAEIAASVLPKHFVNIKQHIYYNTLKITEVEPIISYIRSLSTMDKKSEDFYSRCREILTNKIEQNGFISLPTSRHLFIVS